MAPKYKIAIIGMGAIARLHANAIIDIDQAELVAGSCRTEENGQEFAAAFGCRWYSDYVSMLDTERPDVATICTPSGAHLEPALACAKRGIHVLCEKPLEITTARARQMIEAAQCAGITLGGIFPQRFNPVVEEVYSAAALGRFGPVSVISTQVPWWRDDAYYGPDRWQGTLAMDGGGALINQSIHGVDMLQWIASASMPELTVGDNPVVEVFAWTAKLAHDEELIEVEDTAVAVLRFRNGALGQILAATSMYPGSLKRFQIAGRNGTAEILEDELITFQFRENMPDDKRICNIYSRSTQTAGGASDPMAIDSVNHKRNICGFLDALSGQQTNLIDGDEALKSIAIVEAIYESAKTGRLGLVS
jgi:UDP-N-acetyl-2-amino-2-deoxyglucuronate dehydrogenase